ncbi:hypothetical protein C1H46_029530 [Malus baccata]|uniref:Uncharacterized protein n=1 Tax=Malus baccata TaxID=106549 RepID=A0A540LEL3_MALBA|nr:hypothetical protein C1H46_029530 [Malus baccata]
MRKASSTLSAPSSRGQRPHLPQASGRFVAIDQSLQRPGAAAAPLNSESPPPNSSLKSHGGGVTVGDGRDYFGASPSGASGESDEGERTSAGGDGDSVDLGGGEASAGGVGED